MIPEAGIFPCERCGQPCRLAPTRNPEARLLRASKVPQGFCAGCAATTFLMNTAPLNWHFEEHGPDLLLHPGIQEQFAQMLRTANSDANPDEIDWDRVVANWNLPIPRFRGNPMNPPR